MNDFAHAKTNLTTHSKLRCYDQENMSPVSMPTSQVILAVCAASRQQTTKDGQSSH